MKKIMNDVRWYAMYYDVNDRRIKTYNVLNEGILEEIRGDMKRGLIHDENSLKQRLDIIMQCYYSYKREWEISIGDLFEKDIEKYEKISVYDEIKDNIPVMARYILREMGLDFRKKSKIEDRIKEETLTDYNYAKDKNLIIEDLLNIIDHYKEEIRVLESSEGKEDE